LLQQHRKQLHIQNNLLETPFDHNARQHTTQGISYQQISAQKIIFCDGVSGTSNPYFRLLPFAINKGQALIVSIPDLPSKYMYKHGLTIVPWQNGLFWIGSTYEWNYTNDLPSAEFRAKTAAQLTQFLRLPFTIIDHIAAERPANIERRPFVGLHPKYNNIGILNGMGTKGCSLAPYFAKQLTDLLITGAPINPQASINRFSNILSR
jgi:glycine/D-amino acid oxidase-like deaminating enzyme